MLTFVSSGKSVFGVITIQNLYSLARLLSPLASIKRNDKSLIRKPEVDNTIHRYLVSIVNTRIQKTLILFIYLFIKLKRTYISIYISILVNNSILCHLLRSGIVRLITYFLIILLYYILQFYSFKTIVAQWLAFSIEFVHTRIYLIFRNDNLHSDIGLKRCIVKYIYTQVLDYIMSYLKLMI